MQMSDTKVSSEVVFTVVNASTAWLRFAGLFSLAVAGQAASLLMIDAGRLIHFQHYRSFTELLADHRLALFVVGIQTVVMGAASLRYLKPTAVWIGSNFRGWQFALIVAFLLLSGAAVTPDFAVYSNSILIGTWVQVLSMVSLILVVAAVPAEGVRWFNSILDKWITDAGTIGKMKLDRFAIAAALWVVALSSSLSFFVYQAHPHVPDETQYVFQARYLAAGQLTMKPPPVPEAFSMYMVPHKEERWYGIFSPGWPALLAVGELAGLMWLVNPLLAGLCVLLTYLLFQELYSRSFARIGVLLLCCSPWFIFMAMSLMSHVATLTFALGAAILLVRGLRFRSQVLVGMAGAMVGIVSLVRPLDGAIVGLLIGIWIIADRVNFKQKLVSAVALTFGMLATALLILPYNRIVTGQALLMPIDAYYNLYFWPKVMALGFGPERGMGWGLDAFPGHSPIEAVINTALNVFQLNTELFGWGVGSLILVTLFVISGSVSKKDLWALSTIAVVAGVYGLFWYHGGPDFGARYWFLSIIPLIALTVNGIRWISTTINKTGEAGSVFDTRVMLAVAVLCITSLTSYIPWRVSDKYFAYLEMQPGIRELSQEYKFGKSLVLIRGSEHPDYQSAWIYNPLNFEGDEPIYAHDKTPEIRAELLRTYSDRQVWIVDGPSIANGEYRINKGPLDPQEMLAEKKN
jgi:hypothetical protein